MGNPSLPESQVVLSMAEWEEIRECDMALFEAFLCLKERGSESLPLLESVQKRLSRHVHKTSNRLHGIRQSFEERSKDDNGIVIRSES